MHALVVKSFGGGFVPMDLEIADPIGAEVLVDVRASGLCHTDLLVSKFDVGYPVPAVFGHEVAGVVAAVGPGVEDLVVGDHVVGTPVPNCGSCRRCRSGRPTLCEHPEVATRGAADAPRLSSPEGAVTQGFGLGGFAAQALVHRSQLVRVPDALPFAQAALLGCGAVTGAGAVLNVAQVEPGGTVVIVGAGGVGLNAITGAIVAGATTIVVADLSDAKLDRAKKFGATHTINPAREDPVAAVLELTGRGADAVFDCVGRTDVTARSLDMVAPGGGLYLIGVMDPTATVSLTISHAIPAQKHIEAVAMGSTVPQRDIPLYADLYLQGRFNLDALVSREIALNDVDDAYAALHDSDDVRVVITKF